MGVSKVRECYDTTPHLFIGGGDECNRRGPATCSNFCSSLQHIGLKLSETANNDIVGITDNGNDTRFRRAIKINKHEPDGSLDAHCSGQLTKYPPHLLLTKYTGSSSSIEGLHSPSVFCMVSSPC